MNKLKELRLEKKLSQADIALHLGITSQAYGHYEGSRREPDSDTACKLADFFNVSLDYLHGRTDIRTNTPTSDAFDDNTVVAIGRGGKRVVYNISDEDADFIDAFLSKFDKKNL